MIAALVAVLATATGSSSTPVPRATPPVPTASERVLFEEGRSEERIAFGLERPELFGIALLRERSLADLTTMEKLFSTGSDDSEKLAAMLETLRPMIERGDVSEVDKGLWGSTYIEPYTSTAPPNAEQWWIVEAGMASVDVDAARVDYLAIDLQSVHPMWLASHQQYAGHYSIVMPAGANALAAAAQPRPLSKIFASPSPGASPVASFSQTDLQMFGADLSKNLAGLFPESAFPNIVYGTGTIADARRGVAIATATEMLEVPSLLGQRDSQAFIDSLFGSLASSTTDASVVKSLVDGRAQFAVPAHADSYSAGPRASTMANDLAAYVHSILGERSHCVLIGNEAAQVYYNATTGQDPNADASGRDVIGSMADLDAQIPGLAAARGALASAKPADWLDIRAKSLAVVHLIMGSK